MTLRLPLILLTAMALAACSREPDPVPEPEPMNEIAPLPEPEPEAPLPEPENTVAPVENIALEADPLPTPSVDEQTLEDAEASGMTARLPAGEGEPSPADRSEDQ